MRVRRQRAITAADVAAVRRGCAQAGLDPEYFGGDDILLLWDRAKSVDDIVQTAIAHAQRTGETRAAASP